jgi:hypothetical protein
MASYQDGEILLNWKSAGKKGKVKIWMATTNDFRTGGKDVYKLLKTVPLKQGKATLSVNAFPSDFYKIVLEAPHNMVNRWITLSEEKPKE